MGARRLASPTMPRFLTALLAAALVVAAVGVAPAAGLHASLATPAEEAAPGARLAGIVGVGGAELEGELRARAVGLAVAGAATEDARAAIVADQLDRTDDRLDDHEDRLAELEAAREDGTISEAAYRSRVAAVAAEIRASERVLNATERAAAGLPAETLTAHGVDASAIATLREQASELRGGEVAAIARSIAGANAGGAARGPSPPVAPDGAGSAPDAPADARNASTRG